MDKTTEEMWRAVAKMMQLKAQEIDDETALEVKILYPIWKENKMYVEGCRVRYNDILFKCLQSHTSQDTWKPDVSPSIWSKVLTSDDGTPLQWEQPDSTNPYMKGDKVIYNNEIYVSIVDNNVWEPGVYGWQKVSQ